jgi:translocation and assembly module TamA
MTGRPPPGRWAILRLRAASLIGLGLATAGPLQAAPKAAPNAVVEGVSDPTLRGEIQAAIGDGRDAPRSPLDARRRAAQAARDAVALLRSEGYYEGAAQPDTAAAAASKSAIRVVVGPRFRLGETVIQWIGAPPDAAAAKAATQALRLRAGAPGRAADILGAEARALAGLRKGGYADAAAQPREVVVDHADDSVRPTLRLAAGAPVRMGEVRLVRSAKSARQKTRARWVTHLAPWKPGARYDPALIAKFEQRLIDTGAYQTATVALAPPPKTAPVVSPAPPRPVDLTLFERQPHSIELGASYSTTEGSGVDAKWTLWNRLGRADSLILTVRGYDIQQKLDLEQDLPGWGAIDQTLKIGGGFVGDRTPAYDDDGGGVRINVVKQFTKTTYVTVGATFDYVSTQEKDAVNLLATPVGESLDLYIATLKAAFTLDRSNSQLNPTRGWRLEAEADPTYITGDRQLEYLKTQAQLSGYLPLGGPGTVLAARVKIGSIIGGVLPDVPADRRFYAGGGGSIRGYGYQDVGPQLSDGTPVGGLSLTEGSIELRQALSRRWGVVVFADAGGIGATSRPGFDDPAVGAGVGVRYDLGFGPLRLDLATPVNPRPGDSPIQVYISIGQAF